MYVYIHTYIHTHMLDFGLGEFDLQEAINLREEESF